MVLPRDPTLGATRIPYNVVHPQAACLLLVDLRVGGRPGGKWLTTSLSELRWRCNDHTFTVVRRILR